jgi:hypothetical protein
MDTMLNVADAGPPVSGNTEAEAVGEAVALTEGLGEPPSDGKGVKGAPVVLAIGYAQDRPSTSLYVRKFYVPGAMQDAACELRRTPSEGSSVLADASLTAGFPGGRFRRVQRLRESRQQPQVSGIVVRRVPHQEAARRPDAPGGLPEVVHQFFENGAFLWHGPTVHSASRWVPDRPAIAGDRGYANFGELPFHALG